MEDMFELSKLTFHFNDLEPYIDALTVETHYAKHHQTYCHNLNKALENLPSFKDMPIEELLKRVNELPEEARQTVLNNGGGYYNHNIYWENLANYVSKTTNEDLRAGVVNAFGSLETFKGLFTKTALKVFGSGWTWLVADSAKNLSITTTANQDTPITMGLVPLLALDVWEHAYYLKYQNRRADYIDAWFTLAFPLP